MTKEVFSQVFRTVFEKLHELPPLAAKKNPYVAAVCGFCAGGVGLGLYFRSGLDFVLPFMIAFGLVILGIPTGGLLILAVPFCWGAYGFIRAKSSNRNLDC